MHYLLLQLLVYQSLPLGVPSGLYLVLDLFLILPVLTLYLQLLNAIQLFGANLDDYLHLLLPPIVKLFDAPDVPLQARK